MDERAENRFLEAEARLDARLEAAEKRLDGAIAEAQKVLDARFDERERKSDIRFDDRLVRTERYIDSRFAAFETSTDNRMETHERTVDGKLHQRSQDIIDRTDLMLQVLDQRLDKFRREIRALTAARTAQPEPDRSEGTNNTESGDDERSCLFSQALRIGSSSTDKQWWKVAWSLSSDARVENRGPGWHL